MEKEEKPAGRPRSPGMRKQGWHVEWLLVLVLVGGWILLQAVILPKLGIPT